MVFFSSHVVALLRFVGSGAVPLPLCIHLPGRVGAERVGAVRFGLSVMVLSELVLSALALSALVLSAKVRSLEHQLPAYALSQSANGLGPGQAVVRPWLGRTPVGALPPARSSTCASNKYR